MRLRGGNLVDVTPAQRVSRDRLVLVRRSDVRLWRYLTCGEIRAHQRTCTERLQARTASSSRRGPNLDDTLLVAMWARHDAVSGAADRCLVRPIRERARGNGIARRRIGEAPYAADADRLVDTRAGRQHAFHPTTVAHDLATFVRPTLSSRDLLERFRHVDLFLRHPYRKSCCHILYRIVTS